MKKAIYKSIAVLLITSIILIYPACRKDELIKPASTEVADPVLKNAKQASLIISNPIIVSTFVKNAFGNRICSDGTGNLYTTISNEGVFKISPTGVVTPFYIKRANFFGIKAAKNGDIYVTMGAENMVAKISQKGVFTPINVSVGLQSPYDLAVAPDNTLYIADTGHNRIVKVTPDGISSVLAGAGVEGLRDGLGTAATFNNLTTIKLSADGFLWVINGNVTRPYKSVRRVTLQGAVTTIKVIPFVFGNDEIQNTLITDVAIAKRDKNFNRSPQENLFLTYLIAKVTHMTTTGVETPISQNTVFQVTDGPIETAEFGGSSGICLNDNKMYILDNHFNVIRKLIKTDK
ncbi:hypothetical protein A0256_12040 [Mucilaginibacter sp. PAMC 26640]|nr:hypothetical protein A0256_12040 [Mucilaginibacter sp. PAMC 26640]